METPLEIDSYDGSELARRGGALFSVQRVDEIPTEVDATLLEDRRPLIVKGIRI